MNTSKNKIKSLMLVLFFSAATISTASARVCFLPDSTDCGEGDVVGSSNVDVPCQYSNCPAYNTNYQTCYTERIYNNGGVNVECKQVKCSLSKSDCEKQEADPNSSQCCNFDSASGCYYMGSCKLCNRDVYDSEKNLGEGYNCYPCKDKNGTFYNCTAIEKECKDINPDYTSKCADTQTAEEVEGIKDSKGNQCYTCKDKPLEIVKPVITITYKETYNSLTPSAGADPEEYYYQTLKFTATSSDNISRTILMKTYPAITCSKPQYTTGSPVTINEGTETIIGSRCGTQSRNLLVSSVAALDTFINGTKVYSFEPHESSHFVFDGLDGTTVETNDYTVKFVKEGKCLYEYRRITVSDSDGVSGDLDESKKCTNSTKCWKNLQKITSLYIETGTPIVHPINKISNRSATCVDDKGETKYETICEGDPEYKCLKNDKKFIPNGCVSDAYHHGVIIKGDKWGTCGCDTSKGLYDTKEECRSGTNSGCGKSDTESCYRTCEAQGYYSTKEECENTVDKVACEKVSDTSDCYRKEIKGFLIRYANDEKRTWECGVNGAVSIRKTTHAWLMEIQPDVSYPGPIPKTVEGIQYQDLPDNVRDANETYQYPAGTYYLCAGFEGGNPSGSVEDKVSLASVVIYHAMDLVGSAPTYTKCFAHEISHLFNSLDCEKNNYDGPHYMCHKFTFEKGKLYLIKFGYHNPSGNLCLNKD